ncbi:MAG: hypothetical protein IPJ77_07765 [Planctomycetes bacterium]|nr:hypothetical protein [Planctomycetota bacterium]
MRRVAILAPVLFFAACGGAGGADVRIGGHVRLPSGEPVQGASLRISWPDDVNLERIEYSAADGTWTWAWGDPGVADFDWRHVVVEPALDGYTFDPTRYELDAHGAQLDLDFTATPIAPLRALDVWWTREGERGSWRRAGLRARPIR